MSEDRREEDFKPLLKEVGSEYRGLRYYFREINSNLKIVIYCLVAVIVIFGIFAYVYSVRATFLAQKTYEEQRATDRRQTMRERLLDMREKQLNRKEDSLKKLKGEVTSD